MDFFYQASLLITKTKKDVLKLQTVHFSSELCDVCETCRRIHLVQYSLDLNAGGCHKSYRSPNRY